MDGPSVLAFAERLGRTHMQFFQLLASRTPPGLLQDGEYRSIFRFPAERNNSLRQPHPAQQVGVEGDGAKAVKGSLHFNVEGNEVLVTGFFQPEECLVSFT